VRTVKYVRRIPMSSRTTGRWSGRESPRLVRAVSALSAVAFVAALLLKVSPF